MQKISMFLMLSLLYAVDLKPMKIYPPTAANMALFDAIYSNKPEEVTKALKNKADINTTITIEPYKLTPLLLTIELENEPIAEQLIAAGANIYTTRSDGHPALLLAMKRRLKNVAFRLLKADAKLPADVASNEITTQDVKWLDEIIKEVNKEKLEKTMLMFEVLAEQGMQMPTFDIIRTLSQPLPLASEVYTKNPDWGHATLGRPTTTMTL